MYFGFTDAESFMPVEEGIVVGWIISNEWTFIVYLRDRNFLLVLRTISLASNNGLYMGHIWYAPATNLRAEWEIGSINFLVKLLVEL